MITVIGLHRLPWDPAAFERDVDEIRGMPHFDELKFQIRQNRENAWLVLVDCGEHGNVDGFSFGHGSDAQAPWLENEIDVEGRSVLAFYLHYVDVAGTLRCGDTTLVLPQPSQAPDELLRRLP